MPKRRCVPAVVLLLLLSSPAIALSQTQGLEGAIPGAAATNVEAVWTPLIGLPLAALFGAALALRPRRRGTPVRVPAVVQTQIVLAIVGALIMFVVGASLARAFGIVGAASLIRYRARIADPKDAAVMLSTLSIGLACGVGLYGLALFATAFMLGVLWLVESMEHRVFKVFELTVATKNPARLRPLVEHILARHHARSEIRSLSGTEMGYLVKLPFGTHTDKVSNAILALDKTKETAVEWDEKKSKE